MRKILDTTSCGSIARIIEINEVFDLNLTVSDIIETNNKSY